MPAWTSSSFAVDYISNRQKELLYFCCCWTGVICSQASTTKESSRNFVMIFFLLHSSYRLLLARSPVEFHFYNMQSSYSSKIYFSDLLNEIKATYWWFLDVFYCIINNNISDFLCCVSDWISWTTKRFGHEMLWWIYSKSDEEEERRRQMPARYEK